ncbi:aryl-sulfate sulfotransferase [Halopiger xanaduensis]|uniref:Arylsulfotransferase n=1 Tax=Halopiger xanaduensis (strain DSM 18323 / JCM 14033 / SH-6) TaxID=797210 RepID=F8DDT6_HALXS|nr:aryl-sulfate sulfotransferase [Halopiger xanaduensis]AEH39190.1 hypothetical protein Halxa_0601 [Halopiger xanaduensis SH-6]
MTALSIPPLGRLRSLGTRTRLRVGFAILVVLSAAIVASAASGGLSTASKEAVPAAPPTENHTVVTESGRVGTITAYAPDGDVIYYNNSRTKYFDVDPVEGDPLTVEYTATETIHTKGPTCTSPPCALNVIERADLETGEVEVVYERYDRKELAAEWHDSTRINESHVVVADMIADQVFIVNTETGIVEWLWDAQADFPLESGHAYPRDWTHLNDVEYIEEGEHEGRIVASLRNQDRVVFLDPETGLVEDWTLGIEDDYDIQYEQHNPDYIPESRGGPAIVVADSENGRVQEFQREDGEWVRTWQWADDRMQWPRDADRLPNGNTLITDTHGNRVLEVDPSGEIVWQVESMLPYDVERLETGAESTSGHSAAELGLESRTPADADADREAGGVGFRPLEFFGGVLESVLPYRIYNALIFVAPVWIGKAEAAAIAVGLLSGVTWTALELGWRLRDSSLTVRSPVYRDRE